MRKTFLSLFLASMLLLIVQACAPQAVPTPDMDTIETIVAQTLAALTPTSRPGVPVTDVETPTSTVTAVPVESSPTPLATAAAPTNTATAISLLTSTPTATPPVSSGAPQVQVTVPTNCRTGPGQMYERVGGLQVGQVADVVGRNVTSTYWIIRNPARPAETCWLWGAYATVSGDTSAVPVLTPPPVPTPVPSFDVDYEGLESCTGIGWWVEINIENTGGLQFRSITLNVVDQDTDASRTLYADSFTNNDGCDDLETRDVLPPGASRIVSSPPFNYDPTGHRLRATITLCSTPGQSGTCITQTANLRP